MTPAEFTSKWRHLQETLHRLRASVYGQLLCAEMLADFDAVIASLGDESLNLKQAAAESGYSSDHLGRLVREGKIPNVGRPNAPKIRRQDLPRKPSSLRHAGPEVSLIPVTPRQIARDVVNSNEGEPR